MRKFLLFLLTLGLSSSALAADAAPQTVRHVEIARYLGQWYEVARLPNRFERDCERNATATYSMDGSTLRVVNRCLKADGKPQIARGHAKIVDRSTNAKLKVTFFWPFYGNYWILGLSPDYDWAVVGGPDRKYLWILSRATALTPQQKEDVRKVVEQSGYDWSKLIWTPQS